MAKSGSITVAATSHDNLVFAWEEKAQSVANNYTTIDWTLKLVADSAGKIISSATKKCTVKVNGEVYTADNNIGIENNATKLLHKGSTTITHTSDGSKTFSVTFEQEFGITFGGKQIGTVYGSGTGTLDTIARVSTISCLDGILGQSSTINITRKSTNFTHTITYTCGSKTGTICTKHTGTSVSWTAPLDLAETNVVGTTVRLYITCYTYSGDTPLGADAIYVYYTIPDSIKPTVSFASITDITDTQSIIGSFVQKLSKLKISVDAEGSYGSNILSCEITACGKTYQGTTITTDALSLSGEVSFFANVTDSRGRKASAIIYTDILHYEYPKINSATVYRSNESGVMTSKGEYLTIQFTSTIYALNNKNGAWYKVESKQTSESAYTESRIEALTGVYTTSGYKYTFKADESSYNIILSVGDKFRTIPLTLFGPARVTKLMSFLKSGSRIVGIAIGKTAEGANVLDIGYKLKLSGGMYGEEEGEKDGWYYKKYNNGWAECWKTIEHTTAISTAWGGLYFGTRVERIDYPITFASRPTEIVSLQSETYQGIIYPEKDSYGINTVGKTACYNICRPSSVAASKFYISYMVKGKWK